MKQWRGLGGMALLAIVACDDATEDCPEVDTAELVCPAEIGPFEVSACGGYPEAPMSAVGIAAIVDDDVLRVTLTRVLFRDDNVICGFAERDRNEIDVLLQPCTLVPEGGVSKGDCWYESVAFDIDEVDVAGATRLTVLQRVDRSVELPPYEPKEIASISLA
ncbi:MAG: hypothetical protein IAG13_26940 [Deltaproteobacteria bacterium]|nr:hypothetical protein [Nannocystaceae bacterium]